MSKVCKNRMVYTDEHHIPLGEAIKTENGELALRVKKAKSSEFDVITLSDLITYVSQKALAIA